jgi:hypothetical protein
MVADNNRPIGWDDQVNRAWSGLDPFQYPFAYDTLTLYTHSLPPFCHSLPSIVVQYQLVDNSLYALLRTRSAAPLTIACQSSTNARSIERCLYYRTVWVLLPYHPGHLLPCGLQDNFRTRYFPVLMKSFYRSASVASRPLVLSKSDEILPDPPVAPGVAG